MNFFADGQELRREREKKGLSLADLARLSGVSKGSIGNFETDVRGLGNKSKLKIWTVLQTEKTNIADDQDADCPQCAAKDREIVWLKEQLSKALDALASKPSPAAGLACGAADGGYHERKRA